MTEVTASKRKIADCDCTCRRCCVGRGVQSLEFFGAVHLPRQASFTDERSSLSRSPIDKAASLDPGEKLLSSRSLIGNPSPRIIHPRIPTTTIAMSSLASRMPHHPPDPAVAVQSLLPPHTIRQPLPSSPKVDLFPIPSFPHSHHSKRSAMLFAGKHRASARAVAKNKTSTAPQTIAISGRPRS